MKWKSDFRIALSSGTESHKQTRKTQKLLPPFITFNWILKTMLSIRCSYCHSFFHALFKSLSKILNRGREL